MAQHLLTQSPILVINPVSFLPQELFSSPLLIKNSEKIQKIQKTRKIFSPTKFFPLFTPSQSHRLQQHLGLKFERNEILTRFLSCLPVKTSGHIIRYLKYGSRVSALSSCLLKYFFSLVNFIHLCTKIHSSYNIPFSVIVNALRLSEDDYNNRRSIDCKGNIDANISTINTIINNNIDNINTIKMIKNNIDNINNPNDTHSTPSLSSQHTPIALQSTPTSFSSSQTQFNNSLGERERHTNGLTMMDWVVLIKNPSGKPLISYNPTLISSFLAHIATYLQDTCMAHFKPDDTSGDVVFNNGDVDCDEELMQDAKTKDKIAAILQSLSSLFTTPQGLFDMNVTHDSGITMGTISSGQIGIDSMCVDMKKYERKKKSEKSEKNETNHEKSQEKSDSTPAKQAIFDFMNYDPFTLSSTLPSQFPTSQLTNPIPKLSLVEERDELSMLFESCQLTFSSREKILFHLLLEHSFLSASESTLFTLLSKIQDHIELNYINIDDLLHGGVINNTFGVFLTQNVTVEFILTIFYTFWSTKEALVKAFGTGFWIPASSIDLCEYLILFMVQYNTPKCQYRVLDEVEMSQNEGRSEQNGHQNERRQNDQFSISTTTFFELYNSLFTRESPTSPHHIQTKHCDNIIQRHDYDLNQDNDDIQGAFKSKDESNDKETLFFKKWSKLFSKFSPLDLITIYHDDCNTLRSHLRSTLIQNSTSISSHGINNLTHHNDILNTGGFSSTCENEKTLEKTLENEKSVEKTLENEKNPNLGDDAPTHQKSLPLDSPSYSSPQDTIFTYLQSNIQQQQSQQFNHTFQHGMISTNFLSSQQQQQQLDFNKQQNSQNKNKNEENFHNSFSTKFQTTPQNFENGLSETTINPSLYPRKSITLTDLFSDELLFDPQSSLYYENSLGIIPNSSRKSFVGLNQNEKNEKEEKNFTPLNKIKFNLSFYHVKVDVSNIDKNNIHNDTILNTMSHNRNVIYPHYADEMSNLEHSLNPSSDKDNLLNFTIITVFEVIPIISIGLPIPQVTTELQFQTQTRSLLTPNSQKSGSSVGILEQKMVNKCSRMSPERVESFTLPPPLFSLDTMSPSTRSPLSTLSSLLYLIDVDSGLADSMTMKCYEGLRIGNEKDHFEKNALETFSKNDKNNTVNGKNEKDGKDEQQSNSLSICLPNHPQVISIPPITLANLLNQSPDVILERLMRCWAGKEEKERLLGFGK